MSNFRLRASSRYGFTLLETTITVLLLAGFTAVALESLTSSRNFMAVMEMEDELNLDGEKTLKIISDDLVVSGWYINPGSASAMNGAAFATDRTLAYFPCVVQQTNPSSGAGLPGMNANFPEFQRAPSLISLPRLPPPALFYANAGAALAHAGFSKTFFGPSRELLFVRSTIGSYDQKSGTPLSAQEMEPDHRQAPILSFDGTVSDWTIPANHAKLNIKHPSEWYDSDPTAGVNWVKWPGTANDVILDGGIIGTSATGGTTIDPLWEEKNPLTYSPQVLSAFRVFTYAVIPSPPSGIGFGRLVRAHSEPITGAAFGSEVGQSLGSNVGNASEVIIDKVLSDNVVRVLFDTARHDVTLGIDQVRVTLFLARQTNDLHKQIYYRILSTVISMRTLGSDASKALNASAIGPAITFPP